MASGFGISSLQIPGWLGEGLKYEALVGYEATVCMCACVQGHASEDKSNWFHNPPTRNAGVNNVPKNLN